MKKLFSLVLALALAFALAVPALASGWDALPTTPPTFKDITIQITALETEENTSVLGRLYESLDVMYPIVKGTLVHFFVEITIPAEANLTAAVKALIANKNLVYRLKISNLKFTDAAAYLNGGGKQAFTPTGEDYDVKQLNAYGSKAVYGYEYWAKGIEGGKDGVAAASIGFYNNWVSGVFQWDNDQDGQNEFFVDHTVPGRFVVVKNTALANSLLFPVDESTGKVDVSREILLVVDGVEYAVTRSVTSELTFRNTSTNAVTSVSTNGYTALKSAFDSYFTALGFGYSEAKYMTEAHFTKYFGTIMETSVKIVYPSGAVVPSAVVTPPAVQPPQTGEAASLIGFVMIALALLAAAVVSVRKVRA